MAVSFLAFSAGFSVEKSPPCSRGCWNGATTTQQSSPITLRFLPAVAPCLLATTYTAVSAITLAVRVHGSAGLIAA